MKKLLLVSSLLVLGATTFAASAPVKIQAEITADNLIISDINGRPILLDFGKISNAATTASNAQVEYKVTSTSAVTGDTTLEMELTGGETPVLAHTNQTISDTIATTIALDKATGTIADGGTEYRGFIRGTINGADSNAKTAGMYEGQSELTVTVK
ncbi:hypothetical protein [Cetobacterium sp.]|uniref:hypothetical protein n=1 Tax=Cetobacterium sp. TaxID=2071632 RepID=UPI003F331B8F